MYHLGYEENSTISPEEIWEKFPSDKDNLSVYFVYKEGDKIHCPLESRSSIKFQAFSNHVKSLKKENFDQV